MLPLGSWISATLGWQGRIFLTAGVALFPIKAPACSVCIGWSEGQGLNGGFYWSALLLTALPFAVVALIGAWVSYATWRAHTSWQLGSGFPERPPRPDDHGLPESGEDRLPPESGARDTEER